MKLRLALIVVVALAAWVVLSRGAEAAGHAGDSGAAPAIERQQDGETTAAADFDSSRIDIQLWTVLAAVGAAGLGLLFFVVRAGMGWVTVPPPQDDSDTH